MVPPGLLMCTITALGARLPEPLERLHAFLIAADQAGDGDARNRAARLPGQHAGARHAQRSAHRNDGADDDEDREDAPEGELAPHPAAIDDGIGIERHGSSPCDQWERTVPPPAAMVNGAQEPAAIVATDRDVGSQARAGSASPRWVSGHAPPTQR